MKKRVTCKHGITVGANCGKCLDAKKRQAGYQEAVLDIITILDDYEYERAKLWAQAREKIKALRSPHVTDTEKGE